MYRKIVLLVISLFVIAGCHRGKDDQAEKAAILSKQAAPKSEQQGKQQPVKMINELPGKAELPPAPIAGPVTTQKGTALIAPGGKVQQQGNNQQQQGQGGSQQQNNGQQQTEQQQAGQQQNNGQQQTEQQQDGQQQNNGQQQTEQQQDGQQQNGD